MHEFDFDALYGKLIEEGIRPRHARRTVAEMRDHYDDLVDELTARGANADIVRRDANVALGSMENLVAGMSSRRELKTWVYRYPMLAVLFYPIACLLVLPATPVIAGVTHAAELARWGLSLVAAGAFTAALLLAMQLLILFG
mgnify:CR=1 FL=1